jgi:type I restriction enzyme, S subunit
MRAMKDSGFEWIGEMPEEWELRQAGQLAEQIKHPNENLQETNLLSLSYGKVKRRDINATDGLLPASFETYNIIESDDIVLRFTDLQNDQKSLRVGRATERGIITSAYVTVRPFDASYSRFMYYALHAYDLRKGFYGMGAGVRQGLKWQEAKYINLPWPGSSEQVRIADYLDAKCEEIDRAITAAEQSIQEYKAYKNSVIFQAVTKGLNPDVPMKDSGIEWIGEIPSGWSVCRGKNILNLLSRPVKEDDGIITCFRDGEVTLRSNRREEGFTVALKEFGYQGIEPGDLVVHGMDGFAGSIGVSDSRGKGSPVLNVLDSTQSKRYLMYYLRGLAYRDVFMALSTGIRVRSCNLSWNKLATLSFVLPSYSEQEKIADYLDSIVAKIDETKASKQTIIGELKAYKKSLIYEVVTGKREVR